MLFLQKSVRFRLIVLTAVLLIFVTFGLLVFNTQMASIAWQNMRLEQVSRVQGALWETERTLNALSEFLNSYFDSTDLTPPSLSGNDVKLWSFYSALQKDLSRAMPLQPAIGCIYLYFTQTEYLLTVTGQSYSAALSSGKYAFWQTLRQKRPLYRMWHIDEYGGRQVFVFAISKASVDISLLVPVKAVLDSLPDMRASLSIAGGGGNVFTYRLYDDGGRAVTEGPGLPPGERHAFLLDSLSVDAYIEDLQNHQPNLLFFIGLSSAIVASIMILSIAVSRWVLKPIKTLRRAFQAVRSGRLDYRIPEQDSPLEFTDLNSSFNTLVSEIQSTKDTFLQSQRQLHKEELRALQKQMRPHFVLNCLNMIHSLSFRQEYEKIRQMSVYLSAYLRYIAAENLDLDTLEHELDAFRNYMNIECLMYRKQELTWEVNCDTGLSGKRIMTMMLLTAAENAIKHGFIPGRPFHISVDVQMKGQLLSIRIADNGTGFSAGSLETFGKEARQDGELNLGLLNIRKRLRLLYGDEARMLLYNGDGGGAVMEVSFPDQAEQP